MPEAEDPSRPSRKGPGPTTEERHYTEEEFAVILRTASEVPEDPKNRTPMTPRSGLTLSEIQEIASEVGIDPCRVSRAAALLPVEESSPLMKLVGGGPRYRMGDTVRGSIPIKDLGRIIEIARQTAGIPGETREVLGGLEWTGSTAATGYGASVTPRGDQTHLQVWANHTDTMAGIYGGVGMGTLGVIAVTLGKLVFGESDAGILASLLSGIPPAFLVARTVWRRSTRKLRERLHDLLVVMRREAEAVVEEQET
jgi:hypothetical protein